MKRTSLMASLLGLLCVCSVSWGQWNPQEVVELTGKGSQIKLPSQFQIVTESWRQVTATPYLVYMPEKHRLLMLIAHDYPHHASIISSDDGGTTWSSPKYVHTDDAGKPDVGLGTSLTYLGGGKLILAAGRTGKEWYIPNWIWFSDDYGETWGNPAPLPPAPNGKTFDVWDPLFVDNDQSAGKVLRLVETGYMSGPEGWEPGTSPSQGLIRFTTDDGRTWSESTQVPEWRGFNEIVVARAKNGDLVAACRSDGPRKYRKAQFDHYSGLGTSISKDNGATWSKVNMLYAWGRHHPSIVVLPNRDMVMTYVVRLGYPSTIEDYPQFGIEAIVSHDNGETWDLDHRYILARWRGLTKGPNSWYASAQSTSTLRMPDGALLTAFGTGYRALDSSGKAQPQPRDIGLVSWRVSTAPVERDRTITDANWESNLRNKFNPDPDRHPVRSECPEAPGKINIAVAEDGARANTSPSDGRPEYVLQDPYSQSVLTLETLPAFVEIRWPKERSIDEIHLLPGAPMMAGRPSTECVPLDYRLQYQKDGQWMDLVPPVVNAQRSGDFYGNSKAYITQDKDFEYIHRFSPVQVKAVRLYVTRSSDSGNHPWSGSEIVPEDKRETAIRSIEVFKATRK